MKNNKRRDYAIYVTYTAIQVSHLIIILLYLFDILNMQNTNTLVISIAVFILNIAKFIIEFIITFLFFNVSKNILLLMKKENTNICWRNFCLVYLTISCSVIVILLGCRDVLRNYQTLDHVIKYWNLQFTAQQYK